MAAEGGRIDLIFLSTTPPPYLAAGSATEVQKFFTIFPQFKNVNIANFVCLWKCRLESLLVWGRRRKFFPNVPQKAAWNEEIYSL